MSIERLLDRTDGDRASPRPTTAPPVTARYQYMPTYILRGLTQLHLDFTPVGAQAG